MLRSAGNSMRSGRALNVPPFPSLEFSLHHADDPLYNEGEYPLVTGERGKELLSYVPYYANHPLVQEAVKELEQLESQQKKLKERGRER